VVKSASAAAAVALGKAGPKLPVMLHRLFLVAALASGAPAALAAPTYIHAGRVIAVPGKAPLGPSTIIVDNGRIVDVRDGHVPAPAGEVW